MGCHLNADLVFKMKLFAAWNSEICFACHLNADRIFETGAGGCWGGGTPLWHDAKCNILFAVVSDVLQHEFLGLQPTGHENAGAGHQPEWNRTQRTFRYRSVNVIVNHARTHTCMHLQLHKTGFSNLPPIAGRCRHCYNTPIYWNLILHIIVEVISTEIHVEPVAHLSAAFCNECARHGRGKGVWTKVVARAREYELQPRTNIRISPTDFPFESTCSCGFAPHAGVFNCLIMHSFFKNWT